MPESVQNDRVKQLCAIASSSRKRREQGLVVLPGVKLCGEVCDSKTEIREYWYTETAARKHPELHARLAAKAGESERMSEAIDRKITGQQTPQGMLCVIPRPAPSHTLADCGGILALAGVQNPDNLGAALRSALAFGFRGVLLGSGCADLFSPRTLRASMGAALRIAYREEEDLGDAILRLREKGYTALAAELREGALPVTEVGPLPRAVLCIGSEGAGIPAEVSRCCDHSVMVPISFETESLNAAAAAAILLWELRREVVVR